MASNKIINMDLLKKYLPLKATASGEIFQLGLHQEYDNYTQTVASPKITQRNIEVLVVEDEPAASLVLQRSLQSTGCKVDTSYDGYSALNKLIEKEYELIVLDWMLPTMTGKEFLRLADSKIRTQLGANNSREPIPVVICSSKEIDDIEIPIVSSFGYYYYWNKSLPFSTVINSLDTILKKIDTSTKKVI
jgi:CheY-like chemotaxis protein